MKRVELAAQLERLGTLPAPLPDPRRVNDWERGLYLEFAAHPLPSSASVAAHGRGPRRQLLVGGIAVAAAGALTALALQRHPGHAFELDAASGAVVLLPDGSSRPVHAGDRIPAGGIIHTGPNGNASIKGTRFGPSQAVLVDDGRLILLPAPPTSTAPAPPHAPTTSHTRPVAPPAVASTAVPPSITLATAPPGTPAATPSTASPQTAAPTSPAPSPGALTVAALELTVARDADGIRLSWTTTDAAMFERYVVVRGMATSTELTVVAEFPDRQITSFTDPAAPQNADLVYRVLALGVDGRPVAMSPTAMLEIGSASTSTTTTEVPPTTAPTTSDVPPTDTTVPPDTTIPPDTSAPPATDPPPTDSPQTTRHRPPPTTAPSPERARSPHGSGG
jgi:hypothetical protein